MARKQSLRDQVLQLASLGLNQKEIGRRVGRSERTIRRWKRGDAVPTPDAARALARASTKARGELRKIAKRETRGRQPIPRDVPIPRAERRTLRQYHAGKWTGKYYKSDWVNYNVAGWSIPETLDFIEALRERGEALRMQIQLIFSEPEQTSRDSGVPMGSGLQRSGSPIVDVGGRDAQQLREFFAKRLEGPRRHPLYVAVLDVTK